MRGGALPVSRARASFDHVARSANRLPRLPQVPRHQGPARSEQTLATATSFQACSKAPVYLCGELKKTQLLPSANHNCSRFRFSMTHELSHACFQASRSQGPKAPRSNSNPSAGRSNGNGWWKSSGATRSRRRKLPRFNERCRISSSVLRHVRL